MLAQIFALPVEESIGSNGPLVGVGGTVLAIQVSALRRRLRRRGSARANVGEPFIHVQDRKILGAEFGCILSVRTQSRGSGVSRLRRGSVRLLALRRPERRVGTLALRRVARA
jgi:hypothetical protein